MGVNKDGSLDDMQKVVGNLQKKAQLRRNTELADKHLRGELVIWPEDERGIPNELVRCALFSAKNHNEKRKLYGTKMPLVIPIIGKGSVKFMGEELRQDDETVWMQLVHMAKEARSESVEFTPHSFIKAIKWADCGESYTRLLDSIQRLTGCLLVVYSSRFDKGVSTRLLSSFEFSKDLSRYWRVQVFNKKDNQFLLFDKLYSRVNFEMRLALPEGATTWLHSFFASHKEPFDHKIETLAVGAGIKLEAPEDNQLNEKEKISKQKERLREAKKTIRSSLDKLEKIGFLERYEITDNNLVRVRRKLKAS